MRCPTRPTRSRSSARKIDHRERDRDGHAETFRLHKDLLALRRTDPAFAGQDRRAVDGAVLGPQAFLLRFFAGGDGRGDRLLLVNFGADLHLEQGPEPLLAPPEGCSWAPRFSTEDRTYGGEGTRPVETLDGWRVMGESAVVLAPELLTPRGGEASEQATARMKERQRRERTRLTE